MIRYWRQYLKRFKIIFNQNYNSVKVPCDEQADAQGQNGNTTKRQKV